MATEPICLDPRNDLETGTQRFPLQFILPMTLISLIGTTQLVDVYSQPCAQIVGRQNGLLAFVLSAGRTLNLEPRSRLGIGARAQRKCALAKVGALVDGDADRHAMG